MKTSSPARRTRPSFSTPAPVAGRRGRPTRGTNFTARAFRLVSVVLAGACLAFVPTACGGHGKPHSTTTTTHKYGY